MRDKMTAKQFIKYMRGVANGLGISVNKLLMEAGINRSTICRYKQGKASPTTGTILKVRYAYERLRDHNN